MSKKKIVLSFIILNAVLVAFLFACIIPTLFYTSVPVNEQHMWFGTDLHQYLIYKHSLVTSLWLLIGMVCNYVIVESIRRD